MKRLLSLFMAVVLLITLVPCCFADEAKTVTLQNAAQLMQIIDPDFKSPISITRAVLTRGESSDEIYLVILAGTKSPIRNINNIPSCVLSSFSLPNSFLSKLKQLMKEHIPAGADVVFAGHSLGGMVAQQAAADKSLKSRYNILNITAFGSPLVPVSGMEGSLHRLADKSDIVPALGIAGLLNYKYAVSFEKAGYRLLGNKAHTDSYPREDIWGAYDCFGVKGGDAVISFDTDDLFRYPYLPNSILF